MTLDSFVFCVVAGVAIANTQVVLHLWRARQRTYNYAARRARELDVTDPRGQAYSDMCTVITLDGKVPCPHNRQRGIYGDEIRHRGWNRAECLDCGRLLPYLPPTEPVP